MAGEYNYDAVMDVQWPFGHGISYTYFEYSDLKCSRTGFKSGDSLDFELTVKNAGKVAGKESVLLYSSDIIASMVPDVKRLRAFSKVDLQPGESKTVRFSIPADELAFVGQDGKRHLEKGDFRIAAGNCSLIVTCTETSVR
jgi:beta-glucosidase